MSLVDCGESMCTPQTESAQQGAPRDPGVASPGRRPFRFRTILALYRSQSKRNDFRHQTKYKNRPVDLGTIYQVRCRGRIDLQTFTRSHARSASITRSLQSTSFDDIFDLTAEAFFKASIKNINTHTKTVRRSQIISYQVPGISE